MMSPVKIWFLASRPKTLPAAIAPVIIGTAMAYDQHQFHLVSALVCLFCAILIQITANLANDYFDGKRGTDTPSRLGPQRVTQAGLVSHRQMKSAIALTIGLTLIGGLYLVIRGGWPILIIGLLSILFSLLYTAGPFPLAYLGLGDVFVFIFFGLVAVSGTFYVQTLSLNPIVVMMGILPGLLSVAILTVNNLRDIDEDRLHNKKTLAVRFGRTFAQIEYGFTLLVAAIVPFIYGRAHPEHQFMMGLCALQGVLISRFLIKTVFTYKDPRQLNPMLGRTGALLFLYSVTFSISLM